MSRLLLTAATASVIAYLFIMLIIFIHAGIL
jgi:hypothetical protein